MNLVACRILIGAEYSVIGSVQDYIVGYDDLLACRILIGIEYSVTRSIEN